MSKYSGYLVVELNHSGMLCDGKIISSATGGVYTGDDTLKSHLKACPEGRVRVLLKVIKIAQHKQIVTTVVIEDVE